MKRVMLIHFLSIALVSFGLATSDVRVAVIGDYGTDTVGAKKVATLVKGWNVERIITTGDNNYRVDEEGTFEKIVGSMYSKDILYPCLGNHDFEKKTGKAEAYLAYFPTVKGQYYYDFVLKETIHFFSLCSDDRCPDDIWSGSKQLLWAEEQIKKSQAPWKIVYFHHPCFSSAMMTPDLPKWPSRRIEKNEERKINLPFYAWGVSAVLSGHLHLYERFNINKASEPADTGVPYIINGAGGDVRYTLCDEPRSSIVSFDQDDGALLIEGNDTHLKFKFETTSGKIIDEFVLKRE